MVASEKTVPLFEAGRLTAAEVLEAELTYGVLKLKPEAPVALDENNTDGVGSLNSVAQEIIYLPTAVLVTLETLNDERITAGDP